MSDLMSYLWIVYAVAFMIVYIASLVVVISWPSVSGKAVLITWLVLSIILRCVSAMQNVIFHFELIEVGGDEFDSLMVLFQLSYGLWNVVNILFFVAVLQLSYALHQQHSILFGGSARRSRRRSKTTEVDDEIDFIDDASSE